MLSGLHGPNSQFTEADYDIIKIQAAESVQILCNQYTQHRDDVVARLREIGVGHLCVRLYDSKEPDGHIMSAPDFSDRLYLTIRDYYRLGIRMFRVDNEPNWSHRTKEFGPWNYVYFMKRVMVDLHSKLAIMGMDDVELISPPLSYSPAMWHHEDSNPSVWTLDEWRAAFREGVKDADNETDKANFYSFFTHAGATVYWQYPRQQMDTSYGMGYKTVQRDSGLSVVAVEYGSSIHEIGDGDGHPVYTPAQVNALRISQYPQWIYYAQSFGVLAAYGFLVGGTPEWRGFQWTPSLAAALNRSGQNNLNLHNGRFEI